MQIGNTNFESDDQAQGEPNLVIPSMPGPGRHEVGRTLYVCDLTDHTSSGTTAADVATVALAANALAGERRGLCIQCWGVSANTANNKTIRILLGAGILLTTGAVAAQNKNWFLWVEIRRLTATTWRSIAGGVYNDALVVPQYLAGTDDLSTALTLHFEVTDATAAAGTTFKGITIESL